MLDFVQSQSLLICECFPQTNVGGVRGFSPPSLVSPAPPLPLRVSNLNQTHLNVPIVASAPKAPPAFAHGAGGAAPRNLGSHPAPQNSIVKDQKSPPRHFSFQPLPKCLLIFRQHKINPASCRGRSVGRYPMPAPRVSNLPNPPKCAIHCHSPQKPLQPSRGRGGRRPP